MLSAGGRVLADSESEDVWICDPDDGQALSREYANNGGGT